MDAVRAPVQSILPTLRFSSAGRACHLLVGAGLITLIQILLAAGVSGQHDLLSAWRSLWQWDGGWYGDIALHGYRAPAETTKDSFGNVAFFPAYPLVARVLA